MSEASALLRGVVTSSTFGPLAEAYLGVIWAATGDLAAAEVVWRRLEASSAETEHEKDAAAIARYNLRRAWPLLFEGAVSKRES